MSSSETLALRPGVARGDFPERSDLAPPWMEKAWRRAVGWAQVPKQIQRQAVEAYAAEVHLEGAGLEDVSEERLSQDLFALRSALRKQGPIEALLPRAFALIREVARRTLGTPHYDVQLFGGWVMTRGGLAELETGEGKTLTAALPASVAGLCGIPVHVITANDYLVGRDAESLIPLYERLGLRVGCVVEEEPDRDARREAYACDITYVTNKQVAFDYLQDRMALAGGQGLANQLASDAAIRSSAVLRGLCFAIVDEADSVLVDDAGTPLILSKGGSPPDEPTVRAALWLAQNLQEEADFRLDATRSLVQLTASGREKLEAKSGSLTGPLAGPRRREEWVHKALSALHLFRADAQYLVRDDAIQIIDQPTGRRSPDRAFEGGMQALIEAKEGLELTPQRETIARISYQKFFGRYLRLAGMTGTASEVAQELWNVYGLRTESVPTRLPTQREDRGIHVFPDANALTASAVERIRTLHAAGRPVLVGTASVGASEAMSEALHRAGLEHQLLSARQDEDEAHVVGAAGEAGRITVATGMAGRGTDIPLGPGVVEAGGLAVVATELGDAGRVDRQLFGRCGRQGLPGSYEQLVALSDRIVAAHLPVWFCRQLAAGLYPQSMVIWFTKWAQRAEERQNALARRNLLTSEQALEELLAFSGRAE